MESPGFTYRFVRAVLAASLAAAGYLPGVLSAQVATGCQVFPPDNIWNVPVDSLPLDPNSAAYAATISETSGLRAAFGDEFEGEPIGIPWTTVPGTQPRVPVTFSFADVSDPGPYPIPPDAPIEGQSTGSQDRRVLVLDRDACTLYEMFYAFPVNEGASWQADSGAVFDLDSHALRPDGWISADSAGLPILPGLVRWEEVASGEIRHALRFMLPSVRNEYVWPARAGASPDSDSAFPPFGQRFRLRADYDISTFSPEVQVILVALKRYGMILADRGALWFLNGAPDPNWANVDLLELRDLQGTDFEAVDVSSLIVDPDSGKARIEVFADGFEQGAAESVEGSESSPQARR